MASITIADREWDNVGPSVDDDVRRLLNRYGADALSEALKRQTKKKPGRKLDNDQLALRPVLDKDASVWLAGDDPFAARTDYSIAKEYSEKTRGSFPPSTHRKLMRKLSENRRTWTLERAYHLSKRGHPYQKHLRALEALIDTSDNWIWGILLESAKTKIAEYEAKVGRAPTADMDMQEVEDVAMNPIRGIGLLNSDLVHSAINQAQ